MNLSAGFQRTAFHCIVWLSFRVFAATPADDLASGFQNPPQSARVQVWWHWMNGNISKQGITSDLEAMRRAGIGGAHIFNAECGIPAGDVQVLTPQWREMFRFAVSEAERMGIELGAHNCPGWTCSGGPWNTPEHAMQVVASSEVRVKGPVQFSELLPRPATRLDYYRDIAVLAFESSESEPLMSDLKPRINASAESFEAAKIVDRNAATAAVLPLAKPDQPQFVQFEFQEAFRSQAILVTVPKDVDYTADYGLHDCAVVLQASDDGLNFRKVRDFILERRAFGPMPIGFSYAPMSARYYRVVFTKIGERSPRLALAEIELLSRPRIENLEAKANFVTGVTLQPEKIAIPPHSFLKRDEIVDLTKNLDEQGRLTWRVPPGTWTILRVGHTPSGKGNHPAPTPGYGLECDKMSKEALEAHWKGMVAPMLKEAGSGAGRTFKVAGIDSYEVGGQNWTPRMRSEFRRRRGYDLLSFLPVLSGRVVGSAELTERFLWDLRRTVSDLFAENFYGHFQKLCRENGLQAAIEPYSGPFESLQAGAGADIPMGEFWANGKPHGSVKLAASIGHTYGRDVIAAEAFTLGPPLKGWQQDAFFYKAQGDLVYSLGVNRFILHRMTHQPWPNLVPGMTMGQWGSHFDASNTWWDQSRGWMQYCARAQYLLQSGRFVADIAYFQGEDSFAELPMRDRLDPVAPAGYDYDAIAPDLLTRAIKVKNGRLVMPSGMSYQLLVLPSKAQMTPGVLSKVQKLVQAGAAVAGPRPVSSPSLENYPDCDNHVKRIADEVWGDCDGKNVRERAYGKGRVFWGMPLTDVLARLGLRPDFEPLEPVGSDLVSIHRAKDEADYYFVSNQSNQTVRVKCAFRVEGKAPELWHPDTGKMELAPVYNFENGRTIVPLRLDPCGSIFVVFRKPSDDRAHITEATLVSAAKANTAAVHFELSKQQSGRIEITAYEAGELRVKESSGRIRRITLKGAEEPLTVSGPWQLDFQPNRGAPAQITLPELISWTQHDDGGVKYFSGTGSYSQTVDIPPTTITPDRRVILDLGRVQNLAEVFVNGRNLGILWKPPFRLDITGAVKPGKNRLEIRVTNLWCNRLIGDEQLPDDMEWAKSGFWKGAGPENWPQWLIKNENRPSGRLAFSTWRYFDANSPLLESGLLGPVKIDFATVSVVEPGVVVAQ